MGRRTMLIVDEHEATVDVVSRLFSRRGWAVLRAGTVADACAALAAPPDVVLLELGLPDGDGTDVLRELRMRGLDSRVVIATAGACAAPLRAAEALRPDAILVKPVDLTQLLWACECNGTGQWAPQPAPALVVR